MELLEFNGVVLLPRMCSIIIVVGPNFPLQISHAVELQALSNPKCPKRHHSAGMGQKPVPPVNIPIPTKIGSKMVGAPTPKWDPIASYFVH